MPVAHRSALPARFLRARATLAVLLLAMAGHAPALTFNYTFTAGTSAQAMAGFQAAGDLWSALLSDPITVNLTVGTASLPSMVVGQAASRHQYFAYGDVRSALVADATSNNDALAIANLPAASVDMLINRTTDSPHGAGSGTPYLDNNGSANNTTISMTVANARALSLAVVEGGIAGICSNCDAFIQFSTNFAFDYDRSNGISAGQIDFIGTAAHEIGHALGFISGVDILDYNSPPGAPTYPENEFIEVSVLDLFRFSTASAAQNAIDWTASSTPKFFSLNRGLTAGPSFSLGVQHGDGRQASHWKDGLGLGLMDPTVDVGVVMNIAANDVMALDAIGWNLASVPEARPALQLGAGLLALALWCGRRRRRAGDDA